MLLYWTSCKCDSLSNAGAVGHSCQTAHSGLWQEARRDHLKGTTHFHTWTQSEIRQQLSVTGSNIHWRQKLANKTQEEQNAQPEPWLPVKWKKIAGIGTLLKKAERMNTKYCDQRKPIEQ